MVLVDAANEQLREQFTPEQWAAMASLLLEPPPGFDSPLELFDVERSYDQMLRAIAARPLRPTMPLVVLSRVLPQELPPEVFVPPLPDAATVERLSSVRPNRSSLRGAYGMFANRLRHRGSEFVFRLNARQPIPRRSHLILTFRATRGR
jgi:hypothetical protein